MGGGPRASTSTSARIERLEAILGIASQWNQTNEMEPLLVQMAEAATKLLKADRASIFLWDRPNHTLVGRPALGVKGGELRIPDDSGVVGQVVTSGEPRRINATDQAQINRQVDRDLGYQTRTLLCVPLRGGSGELFGAFEVINKLAGDFSADDEQALVELAAHAAIALENTQQFEQLLATHRHIVEQAAEGVQLIGESPAIEALRSTIRRVADTELAILILGENGTGKGGRQPIDSLSQPPPRRAVHRRQLRGDHRDAAGERACSATRRGLYRRPRKPPGQIRAGLRRHAVLWTRSAI